MVIVFLLHFSFFLSCLILWVKAVLDGWSYCGRGKVATPTNWGINVCVCAGARVSFHYCSLSVCTRIVFLIVSQPGNRTASLDLEAKLNTLKLNWKPGILQFGRTIFNDHQITGKIILYYHHNERLPVACTSSRIFEILNT